MGDAALAAGQVFDEVEAPDLPGARSRQEYFLADRGKMQEGLKFRCGACGWASAGEV
jgi:hypothetical protein